MAQVELPQALVRIPAITHHIHKVDGGGGGAWPEEKGADDIACLLARAAVPEVPALIPGAGGLDGRDVKAGEVGSAEQPAALWAGGLLVLALVV